MLANPADTRMLVYPTMDYYLTAMKIAFTEKSISPTDVRLFMTMGPIFKKLGIPITDTVDYSNSCFKKIIKQYEKFYSFITTKVEINNIQYKEDLWSAAKDVFVSFIIQFRLQYDPAFGRIIYFLKEHGEIVAYDNNKLVNEPESERTETGIMISNIINNLTLDDMQFVYSELPQKEEVQKEEVVAEEEEPVAAVKPSLPVLEERAELPLIAPAAAKKSTKKSSVVATAPVEAAAVTAAVPIIKPLKKKTKLAVAVTAAPPVEAAAAPVEAPVEAAAAPVEAAAAPIPIIKPFKKTTKSTVAVTAAPSTAANAAPTAPVTAAPIAPVTATPKLKFRSTKNIQKP